MIDIAYARRRALLFWLFIATSALSSCLVAIAQRRITTEPPPEVRKALISTLLSEGDLVECLGEFGQEELNEFERATTIEKFDFNGDGRAEYLVRTQDKCSCGAQNCTISVYKVSGAEFEPVLEGSGISFEILKTKHAGFHDTIITAHDSAATVYKEFYVFDGKRYKNSHSLFVNLETGQSKPSERQIIFNRGASSKTVSGNVPPGFPDRWIVRALAGQTLSLIFAGPRNAISYFVLRPDYGSLVNETGGNWNGVLPVDGDYHIVVQANHERSYKLTVSID